MKMYSKITSGLVAMCTAVTLVLPVSASTLSIPENVGPDTVTGRGTPALVASTANQVRVTNYIGDCEGEWNSFFNWGRAVSGVWSWGNATYLYAEATVTANGQTAQTRTKSSTNSNEAVKTDKIYQSEKEGRQLSTYHIVRGYFGASELNDYRNESYSGEWEF